jgi:Arc/MetJ-type ribon-helix-helix transcriptional regulator
MEQEKKLAVLRAALIEGETSGASAPFDFEAFVAAKRAEVVGNSEEPIEPGRRLQ